MRSVNSRISRFLVTDLKRSFAHQWAIVVILFFAFLGPAISSILRSSVDGFLISNQRLILTADISLSAYRPIRDDEVSNLKDAFRVQATTREIEFVTMVAGRDSHAGLLEIHAVAPEFPLEGRFVFQEEDEKKRKLRPDQVWVTKEAASLLDLHLGDELVLGKKSFHVSGIIEEAPGMSRSGFSVAPRIYIPIEQASQTGLTGFGSQIFYRLYMTTKTPVLLSQVKDFVKDPDLFVRTPETSTQGISRFTGYISQFLGVISVTLFSLGFFAVFYIFQTQAGSRMRAAAIAIAFGARKQSLLAYELVKNSVYAFVSALTAFGVALMGAKTLEPWLVKVFLSSVPGRFSVLLSLQDLAIFLALAVISAVIFTIPFLQKLKSSELSELFSDETFRGDSVLSTIRSSSLFVVLIAFSILILFSGRFLNDFVVGTKLVSLFFLFLGFIYISSVGLLGRLPHLVRLFRLGGMMRLLATQLARASFATRAVFLVVAITSFITIGIGQSAGSLAAELGRRGNSLGTPDFFVFNIPESELEGIQSLARRYNSELGFLSPMILARIESRNGTRFEDSSLMRFPVRITWRDRLIPSEKLIEGKVAQEAFNPQEEELPWLSIEQKFFERHRLRLDDRLDFDVQGVPISGVIKSVRRVRWTDFNPNFFISFQAGVLEDAPKTWLANMVIRGEKLRYEFQREILRDHPSISLIDVRQSLEKIVTLMRAVLGPIEIVADVAMAFSAIILIALVLHSAEKRAPEMLILVVFGSNARSVKLLYICEFFLVSLMGAIFGAAGGIALGYMVSTYFLDLDFMPDVNQLMLTILAVIILGTTLGGGLYLRVSRTLSQRLGIRRAVV